MLFKCGMAPAVAKKLVSAASALNWKKCGEQFLDTGQKIGIIGTGIGLFQKNDEALVLGASILIVYLFILLFTRRTK